MIIVIMTIIITNSAVDLLHFAAVLHSAASVPGKIPVIGVRIRQVNLTLSAGGAPSR